MKAFRVRELLLLTAPAGLALGWMADRARTARRDAASSGRAALLADRVVEVEARAEDAERRLRECEAECEAEAEGRGETP